MKLTSTRLWEQTLCLYGLRHDKKVKLFAQLVLCSSLYVKFTHCAPWNALCRRL